MIPFANWLWFSICVGFIITCELYFISRALRFFLIVVLSSLYWMIPCKPCTKKRMWSTKPLLPVFRHTSKATWNRYHLIYHTQASDNLRKSGVSQIKRRDFSWWFPSTTNYVQSLHTMWPCFSIFHDFFFLNNSPYPLSGERTSVCFQLRKCSDINAPLLPPYY